MHGRQDESSACPAVLKGRCVKTTKLTDTTYAYLMILPVFLLLASVMIVPLFQTIWYSFHEYLVFEGGALSFVGLQNYRDLLLDERFFNAMKNTLLFTVITVSFQLLFGFVIAMTLHKAFAGRWIIRVAVLLPWALPTIINSLLFRWMFDANFGLINDLLLRMGIISNPVNWLISPLGANFTIYFTQTWKMSSYMGLILLAGLQSIPESLYESAKVDGAGKFRQFFSITLPLLRPSILIALIFRSLIALQVFDVVFAITQGGPGISTETMVYAIYMRTFRYTEFGPGSAYSFVLTLLILVCGMLYIRALYRKTSAMGTGV